MSESLDIRKFSALSAERAEQGFKTYKNVPITYWTTALAGEVGELCNMIKKMERVAHGGIDGGSSYTAASLTSDDLKEEIGGIYIYLDILSGLLGVDLSDAIIHTFNSKSDKYGFEQKYESPSPSFPETEQGDAFSIVLADHWRDEKKTATERMQENRLSDPAEVRYWMGYYEAIDNALAKYLSVHKSQSPPPDQPESPQSFKRWLDNNCDPHKETTQADQPVPEEEEIPIPLDIENWFVEKSAPCESQHPVQGMGRSIFESGAYEMYQLKQREIIALQTRLSSTEAQRDEARNDAKVFQEWWKKAKADLEAMTEERDAMREAFDLQAEELKKYRNQPPQ